MNGAQDLLETVAAALGRGGADAVDLVEAAARVAWSTVVEPGDAVAGLLVQELGAERSFALVRAASDDGPRNLHDACADHEVAERSPRRPSQRRCSWPSNAGRPDSPGSTC